ncbi:nitrite reductase [Rhizobium yanglingense]|nr:nitrite reductase [Rhizobium yanglingense]
MVDKVLTANRLTDGVAVWLNAGGEWVTSLQDALIARHAEAVTALEEIGKKSYADNKVVDVDVIEVQETNGVLWPLRLRERIRAQGPTMEYAPGYKPADPEFIAV